VRINAAARANGTTYSRLMGALKTTNVGIDRKILADLAVVDPGAFTAIAQLASATSSRGAKAKAG